MSATESPRFASCSATEVPTMPAPRTIASVRCAISVLAENSCAHTYRIRTRRRQAWLICRDNRSIRRLPGVLDAAHRDFRGALLARPARDARGRGVDLYRHRDATAGGAVQANLSVRAVRAALPRVPARRSGGGARALFAPAHRGRGLRLDDARNAAAD